MQRWELKEGQKAQRERLSRIKSTLDTRAPSAQPHLTLYGRDYASKKKATTEAAFADLKMIQAIAKTMTRKHEVAERKGPVSLNADSRKADIYRIMNENHRLLEHIDGVEPFCNAQELVNEHRFKQRYVINCSHTGRLSGEYSQEEQRIRAEDKHRFEMSLRSTQLRKDAAGRLGKTTGSISLPSLTSAASSEPTVPALAKQGAQRKAPPSKGWSGPPGEANAAELKRGTSKQPAKPSKPREPSSASPAKATEPSAAKTTPKPAVRFSSQGSRDLPTPLSSDVDADADEPLSRSAQRKATPHPKKLVKSPSLPESETSETCDDAHGTAALLEEAALNATVAEDAIVVEDDFVADPPAPPTASRPAVAAEAQQPAKAGAPSEYKDDFEEQPGEEEPKPAQPRFEEPPADEFEEAAPGADRPPPVAQEESAAAPRSPPALAEPSAVEPEAQEPFLVPSSLPAPAIQQPPAEQLDAEEVVVKTPPNELEAPDTQDLQAPAPEAPKPEQAPANLTSPKATPKATPAPKEAAPVAAEESYEEDGFEDEENEGVDPEPEEEEPTVEPAEKLGVTLPEGGLEPVSIARPAKQDAGAEDQGQDEYEDEYEEDFVNENDTLGNTAPKNDFEATFEEDTFEEATQEESQS